MIEFLKSIEGDHWGLAIFLSTVLTMFVKAAGMKVEEEDEE